MSSEVVFEDTFSNLRQFKQLSFLEDLRTSWMISRFEIILLPFVCNKASNFKFKKSFVLENNLSQLVEYPRLCLRDLYQR